LIFEGKLDEEIKVSSIVTRHCNLGNGQMKTIYIFSYVLEQSLLKNQATVIRSQELVTSRLSSDLIRLVQYGPTITCHQSWIYHGLIFNL
jgi:hypothetical protein